MISQTHSSFESERASVNLAVSRYLSASAGRAIRRSKELCHSMYHRWQRPDYIRHIVKYGKMFPRMRRWLPLAGGDRDPLHIETEERPEGMVAHLSGEVDLANVARLKDALQPALSNCRNVILDMSNLSYIDCTGLKVLIEANKELQQGNCQLIVVGASPGIAKVMRILQLDKLMPLVSSVGEALELIRTKSSGAAADG